MNKNNIILGIPGLKALGFGLGSLAAFKRVIYFHGKRNNPHQIYYIFYLISNIDKIDN